ncbi:MAG: translation initiation factor IF-2 [Treponema sp. CETP13]|nr:MAG: translation initiation factor IF-2 [Treponema sp. CETP13]
MSEDTENKKKTILHKKNVETEAPQATIKTQKKRVVKRVKATHSENKPVVNKSSTKTVSDEESSVTKKVVVATPSDKAKKKTDKKESTTEEAKKTSVEEISSATKEGHTGAPKIRTTIIHRSPIVGKARGPVTIDSKRPNSKQGNLADKPKRTYNDRGRSSGFTGTQAREGYQRNNNNSGSRPSGQGGYNGNRTGGYNGSRPSGQGGYNGNRTGGYNGNRPSGGGYNRPGGNNRGGGGFTPPTSLPDIRSGGKKSFNKKNKQQYSRKRNETPEDRIFYQKKKQQDKINSVPSSIDIMETISVQDLAKKMNLKASDIIAKLMGMGMMVTITESIDSDTATLVASEFNCEVHLVSLYDETVIESDKDIESEMLSRPPTVTIMGHVDHGKTKTLDAIRSTNVIASEFGGITQHIGAYQVTTFKGKITFLDTPGHEAFTMMRARGADLTDIVVLVVAADDGVMPQTVEAINHAKDAKVPIIVAVNKIDKPDANPDKVMTQLSEYGLTPEEWGGETQFVKISALKKEGLDDLLDAILLQAELLELKANWTCHAEGKVIESKIDQGRGIVSTIMVQRGTLRVGDNYVAGVYSGRVRAIFNDCGQKIEEATPSMPVEILGLEGMPDAGDPFQVTENEKIARSISSKRQELKRFEVAKAVTKVTLDNLYDTIDAGTVQELKVIIKSDVQGAAEALKQSLEKLSTKDIRLNVIHSSAGAINESDVVLASADSNAIIIGFNVRPTPKAKLLAEQEKVDIRKYTVIYQAVEEITAAMEGMLSPDSKENVIGMLEVRDTFKVPKIGLISGAYVTQGVVKRNAHVNIIRDGIVINSNAKISSLKRFKDDAKSVEKGFECGIGIANWQDVKVGDQMEIIEFVDVARKLGETLVQEKIRKEKESKKAGA